MIDLKSVVEKYPECLESATKFKSYMMDLYPENADRARIKVLTDVINCGIVDEIKDGKTDSISIANYRDKMENAFGYSGRLVLESIMQWIRAFETNHKSDESVSTHNVPVVIDEIHTHHFVDTTVVPTCIEQGYTLHKCSCGYEYKDNFKPLVQHEFELVDKIEPTCISEGRKDFLCPVCSEYKSETIPKLPHQMSEWKILKNATCKENGLKERRCVFCGKTETEKIPQLSHNWTEWTTQTYPSCIDDGKSIRQCTVCGEVEEKTLPAKGHDFSTWNQVDQGVWETICSNCGKIKKQNCTHNPNLFEIEDGKLIKYLGNDTFVTIPNGVKVIAEASFAHCTTLTHVDFPNTLRRIENDAFMGCKNLRQVELSENVKKVSDNAFPYDCKVIHYQPKKLITASIIIACMYLFLLILMAGDGFAVFYESAYDYGTSAGKTFMCCLPLVFSLVLAAIGAIKTKTNSKTTISAYLQNVGLINAIIWIPAVMAVMFYTVVICDDDINSSMGIFPAVCQLIANVLFIFKIIDNPKDYISKL